MRPKPPEFGCLRSDNRVRRDRLADAQDGVREKKSLRDVYEMARRRMDPEYGKYPIYDPAELRRFDPQVFVRPGVPA